MHYPLDMPLPLWCRAVGAMQVVQLQVPVRSVTLNSILTAGLYLAPSIMQTLHISERGALY